MMSLRQTSTPRNLLIALTLVLAGCGGGNSDSTADTSGSGASTARQEASDLQQPAVSHGARQSFIQPVGKPSREEVPEGEIENPIFADPIPVPIPEGEGPNVSDGARPGDNNTSGKEGNDSNDSNDSQKGKKPETAEKPPRESEPEPVAQRPSLYWDSPMTREDGSKLFPGEISGYKVYYKLLHQKKYKSINVEGADVDHLALVDFGPGAYEFAVSTIDSNGVESRRSEPVQVDLI